MYLVLENSDIVTAKKEGVENNILKGKNITYTLPSQDRVVGTVLGIYSVKDYVLKKETRHYYRVQLSLTTVTIPSGKDTITKNDTLEIVLNENAVVSPLPGRELSVNGSYHTEEKYIYTKEDIGVYTQFDDFLREVITILKTDESLNQYILRAIEKHYPTLVNKPTQSPAQAEESQSQ